MSKHHRKSAKRSADTSQADAPDSKRRRVEQEDQATQQSTNNSDNSRGGAQQADQDIHIADYSEKQKSDTPAKKKKTKTSKVEKRRKKKSQLQQKIEKDSLYISPDSQRKWNFLDAGGGRYLSRDPVFTPDGKHFILSTLSALHVYSIETSLQLRSLRCPAGTTLTDYKMGRSSGKIIYASTSAGHIRKWRWDTGELISTRKRHKHLDFLYPVQLPDEKDGEQLVTCSSRSNQEETEIEILDLSENDQHTVDSFLILRASTKVLGLWVSSAGHSIIAFSASKVYIGSCSNERSSTKSHKPWYWRELSLSRDIVAFDVRRRTDLESRRESPDLIDVVVGCRTGEILVYEDLLNNIPNAKKDARGQTSDLNPRILHWHRNAATSVKWSREGNYLISGGDETVLVIWQLDTDHRQYLPHLSSPIISIVVSPSGSSYAVRLANNSVVVLETSSLEPTATFSGLGLSFLSKENQTSEKDSFPMTMDALDPRCILAAIPASQSSETSAFLQTFDTVSTQHIARQALARNSTTTFNRAPTGNEVSGPSIKHLKMTSDGQWLVSVEQWVPAEEDLSVLHSKDPEYSLQRSQAKEVNLKFWKREKLTQSWNLNTRMDGPHNGVNGATGSILDVVARPNGAEIATIGEDANVRIWRPKIRRRHGQAVKDASQELLQTWSCHRCIQLVDRATSFSNPTTIVASLAYSEDRSTLAAYFHATTDSASPLPPIYFLDPQSGSIRHQISHLVTGQSVRFGFLDQYLIVLSDHLRVWDTVNSRLVFGIPITKSLNLPAFKLLSIQHADRTFAVSFPLRWSKKPCFHTQIAVFNPDSAEPLFQKVAPTSITGLMSLPSSGGFVLTDEDAAIHFLRPPGFSALPNTTNASVEVSKGLERLFGPRRDMASEDQTPDHAGGSGRTGPEVGPPVAGLLEGLTTTSSESLSVRALFERVATAYSGKEVSVA